MVKLGEGVARAEVLLVEIEGRLCDTEQKLVSEEFNEALADEDSLRHIHGVIVLKDLVGTGADGIQIGRDLGRLFEIVDCYRVLVLIELEEPLNSCAFEDVASAVVGVAQIIACLNGVGDGTPVGRAQHDKRHLRF